MEEDFINGVYHHLYYTLQMVWERVLKSLDSCADDVEDAQQKFQVPSLRCFPRGSSVCHDARCMEQVQIDQLNTTLSREISGHRGSAFHHSHNRFAGMVDYNSFCVSNGRGVCSCGSAFFKQV